MSSKDTYLNVIRRTVIVNSFLEQYFIKIVVIYLLSKGITPWIAVSLPVVLEFAKIISRAFKVVVEQALKINYKKYHLFYLIILILLCIIISQCSNIYTIYFFTMIMGTLTGLNNSCITKINTSNPAYESFCFIEEERSFTIGATLGLIVSQIFYDISPILYIIGFVLVGLLGFVMNSKMPDIKEDIDIMESIEDTKELSKKEKKGTIIVTLLFGIMAGLWCMGVSGLNELAPLISNKVGYLNAIYTGVELIVLFVINGKIIVKIKEKKKLLFWEMIVAVLDVVYLLVVAFFQTPLSLAIVLVCTGISSTIGDPIWGSIVSSYSTNNRRKYVLINNIYFLTRAVFTALTWLVCKYCVIIGNYSFFWLSIILVVFIILTYAIANKVNQKVFGATI